MESHQEMLKQLRIDRKGSHARSRKVWWWLLAVVPLVAGIWFFRSHAPLAVDTAAARSAADAGPVSLLDASGFVTARRIATGLGKITGKVRELFIEEGQQVDEGQILATLDDADAQAALRLSEAQHRAAIVQLAEMRANLALAERDLTRQQDLVRQQLASQQSLDNADTNVKALAARIASQQAQVEVTAKSIAVTRQQLDNTIVRAPFAGVITVKAAQPGEMISPISAGGGSIRTGIGTLVDMDSLEIQVDVNEAYIGRVTPGMPVQAVLNAYPDWKIPGRLLAIIPTADRSKATVKVRIAISSKDHRIVPDMGVRVSFLETLVAGAAKPTGVWIPAAAVVTEAKQSAVFVIGKDSKATRVPVTLGEKRDADQHVEGGLNGGERVIVGPPAGLADGRRVQASKTPSERPVSEQKTPLVRMRELTKAYVRGSQRIEVLHGIDLDIPEGDFVALMGPSGSGKTTLLNLIGGLDSPSGGQLLVDGQRIDEFGSDRLAAWRAATVGFIFQSYNLMPVLSAQKNVELPLLLSDFGTGERALRAGIALRLVGLADRARHKPNELSGGQQQRVAIARALVSDPRLLICDEPTGDLDRHTADEVLTLLQQLNREFGKTIVMVTHDPKAAEYANHIVHLDKGVLAERMVLP